MNKKHHYSTFFKVTTASAIAASIVIPVASTANAMSDVPTNHQFYQAVHELQERGIINGYSDGTFKPEKNLTRGQAAKIIAGVLKLDTVNVTNPNFQDIPKTHQYYGAIAALKQANIIDGYSDGTFKPNDYVQRNHIAKFLAIAMNLKATNSANLPFRDVHDNYREHIAALYENGVTKGKTETLFDGSSYVTRGQIAAFIIRAEKGPEADYSTITKSGELTLGGIITPYWNTEPEYVANNVTTLGIEGTTVEVMGTVEETKVFSSNQHIVTAKLKDGQIMLTAKEPGTAIIKVTDGKKEALISASVDFYGFITTQIQKFSPFLFEEVTTDKNTIKPGTHGYSAPSIRDYIFNNADNTFSTLEVDETIKITTYDNEYKKLSEKTLALELPVFGAFYSGDTYNYIAYGQNNPDEKNIEVVRIVKYDKSFNRIAATSVKGDESITVTPFRASSGGRLAEEDDTLAFHTSRLRYKSEDGLNHQSQLTIEIDTNSMEVTNTLEAFQANHVSHSFDQYVLIDDGFPVYLDHGDAYPRSLVLHKLTNSSGKKRDMYAEKEFFNISGGTGANITGVSIGGFEQSNSHYLAAFNSINQSERSDYSYYTPSENFNNRNIYLYGIPKNLSSTHDSAIIETTIANYEDTTFYTTTPTLVKITNNKFIILWQEYVNGEQLGDLKYVYVDGNGQMTSQIYTFSHAELSTVQPIVKNNKIIWYTYANNKKVMYELEIKH